MSAERRTRSGLVVPPSVSSVRALPYSCALCGARFYDDEMAAYQRHVARCARSREAEIREMSPRARGPAIFGDEGWDVEWARWVREHPRRWMRERGIRR